MKILHIADVNWVGVSSTFVKYHNLLGNYSRLVTLVKNNWGFPEDIVLNLPLLKPANYIFILKEISNFFHKFKKHYKEVKTEKRTLRVWQPRSKLEEVFFRIRDRIWGKKVFSAIEKYNLLDYDVYQLDGGHGFFRNSKVVKSLHNKGKAIVIYYLGTDFRDRGVIRTIDRIADLIITTEFDHYLMDPTMIFEFLPVETDKFEIRKEENKRLKIFHAIRSKWNRETKGTDFIVESIKKLQKDYDFEFLLIEGLPHEETLKLKMKCDIGIEQIGNKGGTGYGMNGIENLLMGIPTVTEFTEEYNKFLKGHPFYIVNRDNFLTKIKKLLTDKNLRMRIKEKGRKWVEEKHDIRNVIKRHHFYYKKIIEKKKLNKINFS